MGQYYKIMNYDKKECIKPYDWENGSKLMEFSYLNNKMMQFLNALLAKDGRWYKDRVLVVGDYTPTAFEEQPVGLRDESWDVVKKLSHEFWDFRCLPNYCDMENIYYQKFKELLPGQFIDKPKAKRYLVNHQQQTFVDLTRVPGTFFNGEIYHINPLPLLLCTSNGLGGGDYYGKNQDFVGDWVKDVGHIETTNERPFRYLQIFPNFIEEY